MRAVVRIARCLEILILVDKEWMRAVVQIARCLEILILGEGDAAGQRNPRCEKKPFHDVDHPLGQLVQTGCALISTSSNSRLASLALSIFMAHLFFDQILFFTAHHVHLWL